MTDIAELGINIESARTLKGAQALDGLAASAIKAETATDGVASSSKAAGSATAAAAAQTKLLSDGLAEIATQASASRTAMQKAVSQFAGIKGEMSSASASADAFTQALNEERLAFDSLRMSIDPLYAASMKYSAAIDEITRAQRLGVITAKEAEVASRLASTRYLSVGDAAGAVGKKSAAASYQTRMMAMQLSQVAQQASATGNWVQALAIQLPDLTLGFGTIGIAAGVLAGAALPLLASAFGGSAEEAKSLDDAVSDLSGAMSAYQSAAEAATAPMANLIEQYGTMADEARRFLTTIQEIAAADALAALSDAALTAANAIGDINDIVSAEGDFLQASELWSNLRNEYDLSSRAASDLNLAMNNLAAAKGPEEHATAAAKVAALLEESFGSYEKMPAEIQKVYSATVQLEAEASKHVGTTESANTALAKMSPLIKTAIGYADQLAVAAGKVAAGFWEAAKAAAQVADAQDKLSQMAFEFSPGGQALTKYGSRTPGGTTEQNSLAKRNTPKVKATRGGSGGGGSTDTYADDLAALVTSLQTERETVDAWYEESQAILADRRAVELLGEEEHRMAVLALEEDYQQQLADIRDAGREMERTAQNAAFTEAASLLNVFAGKSKAAAIAAIAINKGLRIAEIIQNTAAAQMRAYAELGPIAGAAAAAKIGLYGKIQAGLVAATGLASAASAGSSTSGTSSSIASQGTATDTSSTASTSRLVIQGIKSTDIFTGAMLFEMLGEEFSNRGIEFV